MPQVIPAIDGGLKSWVESANDPGTDFPIQNLPLGVFHTREDDEQDAESLAERRKELAGTDDEDLEYDAVPGRLGVAIGDRVVDLGLLMEAGWFESIQSERLLDALETNDPNLLVASPARAIAALRARLVDFLKHPATGGQQVRRLREKAVLAQADVRMACPVYVGNYTDFYASINHARTVGSMFRPENPLLPNYVHVPIGYHGRASSIVASGTGVRRPMGQTAGEDNKPGFGASKLMDYELEMGVVIGRGNALGEAVPVAHACDHVFGMCLVNDWSARDVQKWEYQPLGPFLAKNFATTIGSWIVPMSALEAFRVAGPPRGEGEPKPLDYLRGTGDWGLDIQVEAWLSTAAMRAKGLSAQRLSRTSFRDMYWTIDQLVAHHTSNGCNLRPGDLLASGTISGKGEGERGCLLELTFAGLDEQKKPKRQPIALPTGETRVFLQDGDEVILKAWCEKEGHPRIGFGECRGIVEAAVS